MSALPSNPFLSFPRQSYILLGPAKSPGVARVRGASSVRNWNAPQAFGTDGATISLASGPPAKFEVDIFLWKPEHFAEWKAFAHAVLMKPIPGVGVSALGIQHPLINGPPLNISAVVVEEVGQFEQNDTGLWMCTLRFLEFRKPIPVKSRPIAAIPAAGPTVQEPPDPQEREIARLMLDQAAKGGVL